MTEAALKRCRSSFPQVLRDGAAEVTDGWILRSVRGPWHPAGAVLGARVFAVRWVTASGLYYWAPLHDFEPADALRLIEACGTLDLEQGFLGAPTGWRGSQ